MTETDGDHMLTVITQANGGFAVADDFGRAVAGPFATNSEAWRWIDRHEGDPISPAERRSKWIIGKNPWRRRRLVMPATVGPEIGLAG